MVKLLLLLLPCHKQNKFVYDEVKSVILKAYELRPEAYRQKFRNYRKNEKQTFVEFVDKQSILFDKWVRSENVDSGYDNLRELVLKEQLNSCLPEDIKTYLAEEAPQNLKKSAELADDYSLIHKDDRKTPQIYSFMVIVLLYRIIQQVSVQTVM